MKTEHNTPLFYWSNPPSELPIDAYERAAEWWEKKSKIDRLKDNTGLQTIAAMFYANEPDISKHQFAIAFNATVIRALITVRELSKYHKNEAPPLPKQLASDRKDFIDDAGLKNHLKAGQLLREAALLVGLPENYYVGAPTLASPTGQPPDFNWPEDAFFYWEETENQTASRQKICTALDIYDDTQSVTRILPKAGKYSREAYLLRSFCNDLKRHRIDIKLIDAPFKAIAELLNIVLDFDVGEVEVRDAARSLK